VSRPAGQENAHGGVASRARGAFSEEAARNLLGRALPFCHANASKTSSAPQGGRAAERCPSRNPGGSVHENYDHLVNFELPIVAETSVRIGTTDRSKRRAILPD